VPLGTRDLAEEPLQQVKDGLRELLDALGPKARVFLIDYGGDVTPHPPFGPAQAAEASLEDLLPDDESGDLRLADAVRAALVELNRPHEGHAAPPRRLIVLVSDGLNSQMDRKTFRALGDAAAEAHVPIHAIAFSPTDERGPLLNLGEIAKRSNGTLRWARSAEDLKAQIETLIDELNKQYVLTFKVELGSLEGHRFQLTSGDLVSNVLAYDKDGGAFGYTGAGGAPRDGRWLWWGLWILGGIGLLGGGLALLSRLLPLGPSAALVAASGRALSLGRRPLVLGKARLGGDPAISTRHARVSRDAMGYLIVDLGSTNGTFVNDRRIAGPTRLQHGDVVRLGQTALSFTRKV
jgi:hypothetical protein